MLVSGLVLPQWSCSENSVCKQIFHLVLIRKTQPLGEMSESLFIAFIRHYLFPRTASIRKSPFSASCKVRTYNLCWIVDLTWFVLLFIPHNFIPKILNSIFKTNIVTSHHQWKITFLFFIVTIKLKDDSCNKIWKSPKGVKWKQKFITSPFSTSETTTFNGSYVTF